MTLKDSRAGHLRRLGAARLLVVGAMTAGLLAIAAGPASAHARLRVSEPAAASTLSTAPRVIRLAFTEVVEPGQSEVLVRGPDGGSVPGTVTHRDLLDARVLSVVVPPRLTRGTYTVFWRVLSIDGHPVSSTLRFAVGAVTTPLTGTGSAGFGPTLLGGSGRALDDVGLLTLLGVTAFPLLVAGPGRRRTGAPDPAAAQVLTRLRVPLATALFVALLGNLLLVVDTAAQVRGFPVGGVAGHLADVGSLVWHTRTGQLLLLRESGLAILGLLLLAAYSRRSSRRGITRSASCLHLVCAAALLVTVAWSGHAGSAPVDLVVSVMVGWTHLAAAGLWMGGLLALAVAGLPAAQSIGRLDQEAGARAAGSFTARFSDMAQLCMLVVLATGSYQALVHVSGLGELGRTAWGGELVAKLAVWLTVLLVATASTASVVPRISRRAAAASSRLAACGELAQVVRFEVAAAVVLIAVAAVLAGTAPPDQLT